MQKCITLLTVLYMFFALLGPAQALEFEFADPEEGVGILLAQDQYFDRMSAAEIAIRMQSTEANKSVKDLKAQYAANLLAWTDGEKAQVRQVIEENRARWEPLAHLLPDRVVFIKMNNNVEGGLPHTQANAILIPEDLKNGFSSKLFFHELFHVISRNNKARHASLYGLIGFKACDFDEPPALRNIHLTNPDVPEMGYYLPLEVNGAPATVMTFLYAVRPAFDPALRGGFPGHFGFGLLKVKVADGACTPLFNAEGGPDLINPGEVPAFFEAIGRNTRYIIHAEEVLADNFVFMALGGEDLPNPEIPERIGAWIDAPKKTK